MYLYVSLGVIFHSNPNVVINHAIVTLSAFFRLISTFSTEGVISFEFSLEESTEFAYVVTVNSR